MAIPTLTTINTKKKKTEEEKTENVSNVSKKTTTVSNKAKTNTSLSKAVASSGLNKPITFKASELSDDERLVNRYENTKVPTIADYIKDFKGARATKNWLQENNTNYQNAKKNTTSKLMERYGLTDDDLWGLSEDAHYQEGLKDDPTGMNAYAEETELEKKLRSKGMTEKGIQDLKDRYNNGITDTIIKRAEEGVKRGDSAFVDFDSAMRSALSPFQTAQELVTKGGNSFTNQDGAYTNTKIAEAQREAVRNNISSNLGKGAYDVKNAVVDMIPQIGVGAVTGPIGGALYAGAKAAQGAINSGVDKGLNADQIALNSLVQGGAETALQYLPTSMLLGNLEGKVAGAGVKSALKRMGLTALSEGIEEGATDIVNAFTENLISGDKSDFNIAVNNYVANGMSEDDAKMQAYKDILNQAKQSAIIGGISGGILGGGTQLVGNALYGGETQTNVPVLTDTQDNTNVAENNTDVTPKKVEEVVKNEAPTLNNIKNSENVIENNVNNSNITEEQVKDVVNTPEKLTNNDNVNNLIDKITNDLGAENETLINGLKTGLRNFANNGEVWVLNSAERVAAKLPQTDDVRALRLELANMITDTFDGKYNPTIEETAPISAEEQAELLAEGTTAPDIITEEDIKGLIEGTEETPVEPKAYSNTNIDNYRKQSNSLRATVNGYGVDNTEELHNINALLNEYQDTKDATLLDKVREQAQIIDNRLKGKKKGKGKGAYPYTDGWFVNKVEGVIDEIRSNVDSNYTPKQTTLIDNNVAEMVEQLKNDLFEADKVTLQAFVDSLDKAMITDSVSDMNVANQYYKELVHRYGEGIKVTLNPIMEGLYSNMEQTTEAPQTTTEKPKTMAESVQPTIPTSTVPNTENKANVSTNNTVLKADESGDQNVRGYNETFTEKTDAPEELKKEFIDNPQMYDVLHNSTTLDNAMNILANNTLDDAIVQYRNLLDEKNPVAIPLGYNISKELTQKGRTDEAVQIVREMSEKLTESGQFSQAAAITMLNNDPQAALRYVVKNIDKLNKEGKEKFGNKWNDFKLTDEEINNLGGLENGDTEGIKNAYENIYKRLAKEYPSDMREKLLEARRIAMLLNVRTNMRNLYSNALMLPMRWTSDRVSALGEGVYSLLNKDYQRTQSLNPIRSKQARSLATEAFNNIQDQVLGKTKYDDALVARSEKQLFKGTKLDRAIDTITNGALTKANNLMGRDTNPSLMETARNFTYYLLEKGDDVFVKENFISRLGSYIQAQGITNIEDIPADAITIAIQEAEKATFHDDTNFSRTLTNFRNGLNSIGNNQFVGDIVMPFTKTPANIAVRSVEYSPLGVASGVKALVKAESQRDVTNAMTKLGQGATGTAAIALGYALAKSGLISGALSDDKDEEAFQKQQGMKPFSINVNGNYYTYDWAQPAAAGLIFGAVLADCEDDSNKSIESALNSAKQGAVAVGDAWLDLSPLQNLSEVFGGYGTPTENFLNIMSEAPLSFIPAQLGATARIKDTTQRETYDNSNYLNTLANKAKAKIPVLSETLPVAYDTWGNAIKRQDSTGEAAFANLLNPGEVGNANTTPLDNEILRLYDETDDNKVFPKSVSRTINGDKLTAQEHSDLQQKTGSLSYDLVASLMDTQAYANMNDSEKANAIDNLYSFAYDVAKNEVLGTDINNEKSYKIYQEKGVEGLVDYLNIKNNATYETEGGSKTISNTSTLKALDETNMTDAEKGSYFKEMRSLSLPGQMAETYGDEYIYKWYKLNEMDSTKEGKKIALMLSDEFTDKDKEILGNILNMSNDDIKVALTVGK